MDPDPGSGSQSPEDPYSRSDYRKLIAWGPRIEREAPFLLELLARAPDRSVLDLGCGTGEHTAFFAGQGCRAVGLDRSESMIASAREHEATELGRFILGDVMDAPAALTAEEPFGLCICLGNMLPHLLDEAELARFCGAAAAALRPGGILLIQLLNYEPVKSGRVRHLPLSFRTGDTGEEIVFLRLMQPIAGGRVIFMPTTLAIDPAAEEPVRVERSRRVELRAWSATELETALAAAGFTVSLHGDMHGGAFAPDSSQDLVVMATRTTAAG